MSDAGRKYQAIAIAPAILAALAVGFFLGISDLPKAYAFAFLAILIVAALPAILVVLILTKSGSK